MNQVFHFRESFKGTQAGKSPKEFDWTWEEYLANEKKYPTLCDFYAKLPPSDKIKPFFDFDMKWESEHDLPDDGTMWLVFNELKKCIQGMFQNEGAEIICAYREKGAAVSFHKVDDKFVPRVEFKISFRFWILGIYTTRNELQTKLRKFMPDLSRFPQIVQEYDFGGSLFDTSVYNANRSMVFIGKHKTKSDKRVLLPVDPDVDHKLYLIQEVDPAAEPASWTERSNGSLTSRKLQTTKPSQATLKTGGSFAEGPDAKFRELQELDPVYGALVTDLVILLFPEIRRRTDLKGPIWWEDHIVVDVLDPFCLLLRDDHDPAHGYFLVQRKEVVYRCHSTKYDTCNQNDGKEIRRVIPKSQLREIHSIYDHHEQQMIKIDVDAPLNFDVIRKLFAAEGEFYLNRKPKLTEYLNNYICRVTGEGTVLFGTRKTARHDWAFRSAANAQETTKSMTVEFWETSGKNARLKYANPFEIWSNNHNSRQFDKIVMDPSYIGEKPGEELNLWRGWSNAEVAEVNMELIKPILRHLEVVLAAGNKAFHLYQLGWCASILQHPERKNGTALVYKSPQGVGKNLFWDWFGEKVVGTRYYLYINDMDQLTKNFNAFSVGKILTVGDEVTYGGGHKANAKLKSLITQMLQLLERKGVDAVQIRDFQNFVFLTNEELAVKIETSDRRYAVSECSDCHKGNDSYFQQLAEAMADANVVAHFFTYLMRYDLSDYNPRKIPDTEAKKNMRDLVKDTVYKYIDHVLEGGSRFIMPNIHNESVNMSYLYTDYLTYCDRSLPSKVGDGEKRVDIRIFGRKFREYMKLERHLVETVPGDKRDGVKVNVDMRPPAGVAQAE